MDEATMQMGLLMEAAQAQQKVADASLRRPLTVRGSAIPGRLCLAFAACYAYSPRGTSTNCARSRLLRARLKRGRTHWLHRYVSCVKDQMFQEGDFRGYFNRQTVLVPVPGSGSDCLDTSWTARLLAVEMCASGMAGRLWTGLRRVTGVPRSADAWHWKRPSVLEHFESFGICSTQIQAPDIVLIDDVVTKGRTLMAAAIRLRTVFPNAHIRAFAMLRTLGFAPSIDRLFDPCRGEILWDGSDVRRNP